MAMPYQPIEDYGVIGDLHTVALVGRNGSMTPTALPEPDGGVDLDAGVPVPVEEMTTEQLLQALPI